MKNKSIGTAFIVTAALMLALGVIGSQVSNAIERAGFMSGGNTGIVPQTHKQASPHRIIVVSSSLLGLLGLILVLRRSPS
jgi:hypothetical protein